MKPRGVKNLRDVIDKNLVIHLGNALKSVYSEFDTHAFNAVAVHNLEKLAFFDRVIHVAKCMYMFLPAQFEDVYSILKQVAPPPLVIEGYGTTNYQVLILCRYVSIYGLNHPDISLETFERLTQSYTAEFDIRPFTTLYPQKTFAFLKRLTGEQCFHKRRLASEGCRSRLPMAYHLVAIKEDPQAAINILQLLKHDPVKYVQRSVANNLADILKDNPSIGYNLIDEWAYENHKTTNWIIKHAMRKPLQRQEQQALRMYAKLRN